MQFVQVAPDKWINVAQVQGVVKNSDGDVTLWYPGENARLCGSEGAALIRWLDEHSVNPTKSYLDAEILRIYGTGEDVNRKIAAVKHARSALNLGLKEAKDYVEALYAASTD